MPDIHAYVLRDDIAAVESSIRKAPDSRRLVNACDASGLTPLMLAVTRPEVDLDLVRCLVNAGADIHAAARGPHRGKQSVLSLALVSGDPVVAAYLLDQGADIHYRRRHGYDALIDAMQGRDIIRGPRLMDLLRLLVQHGAPLNGRTAYGESGLRVASNLGRFDAVALLLQAGADPAEIRWTPLMQAIALSSVQEVEAALEANPDLAARDTWGRTPWLLAIQTGSIPKAQAVLDSGTDAEARGWKGKPPLFYAIGNRYPEILRWLLESGQDRDQADDFGQTALMEAAETGDPNMVVLLVAAGADIERSQRGQTALSFAASAAVARHLLEADADPAQLSREGHRLLLGYPQDPTEGYRQVSPADYLRGRFRRFGTANPELIQEPFWEAMVRSGATAWSAAEAFREIGGAPGQAAEPVWCAQRFGQSLTVLPDGRIIQTGGEHEDGYDPDFCIYNDVIVHYPNGRIQIFGYPETLFPPTDFHTATLVGDHIYIVGSLGYPRTRRFGVTPVFRLDLRDFHIEPVAARGDEPGWISRHRARLDQGRILVSSGELSDLRDGEERYYAFAGVYALDLASLLWSRVSNPTATDR